MSEEQVDAYVRALGEYVEFMASAKLDTSSVKDAFQRRRSILRILNALPMRQQVRAGLRAQDVWSVNRSQPVRDQILKNEHAVELYIQKHELWE